MFRKSVQHNDSEKIKDGVYQIVKSNNVQELTQIHS